MTPVKSKVLYDLQEDEFIRALRYMLLDKTDYKDLERRNEIWDMTNEQIYELGLHDAVNSHTRKQVFDYIEEPIAQHVDRHVLSTIWGTVKNKSKVI
jgi:hypothetical protein